eukprot:TRINITY_DN8071_c1_g3_i3.p1 TRINITY_DN8071_c1_g3~~TRINITY_DN8071_c1_g3_i3.p1  ORF type:complete len:135 (-),score=4.59 TRINITY_DN8071_c1_g3_i3:43-447(-)
MASSIFSQVCVENTCRPLSHGGEIKWPSLPTRSFLDVSARAVLDNVEGALLGPLNSSVPAAVASSADISAYHRPLKSCRPSLSCSLNSAAYCGNRASLAPRKGGADVALAPVISGCLVAPLFSNCKIFREILRK